VVRRPLALLTGIVLLLDVLHVFLPSIITIFGQAASTPAELLGAFALVWFLAGFVAPPLARWVGPRRLAAIAAVALAAARVALLAVHGGQPQLYTAAAGTLAGIVWLAAMAMAGARVVPGVPGGIAVAAVQHAALGTVDLTWRRTWWAWLIALAEVVFFLLYALRQPPEDEPPGRGWLVVGPTLLLAGWFAVSPAAVTTAMSYDVDPVARSGSTWLPALLTVVAATAFMALAVRPPRGTWPRWLAGAGLVVATVLFGLSDDRWLFFALLLGSVCLGACLGLAALGDGGRSTGYAAVGGMVLFAAGAIAYYAAYDLGYPNAWVPAVIGLLVATPVLRAPAASGTRFQYGYLSFIAVILVVVTTWWRPPGELARSDAQALRLVTYNVRMGFGLDGTYDPDAVARAIAAERPDVVTLSEVDRGWLLNGGHDNVTVLAKRLNMRYFFAPAADSLWGDAILTNLPVSVVRTVRLPSAGAPTGAQALGVVLRMGARDVLVVSTHLQPPPGGPPTAQANAVIAFAGTFGAMPAVIAGDLNIAPDSTTMAVFASAGFADALAAFRPVPTFPADRPVQQIDHVLVHNGLAGSALAVPRLTASDHLPVAVTLTLP
jgi:endonuclease/exonuclease/phosphatase family metal-dependent hydrolase